MACAGKILGTFVVAMLCMIPARESLVLGVLMNTKGFVKLIVLNIGKEKKGGILLGPSAFGRNKHLFRLVFPSWSTPISVASIGLLFYLFLVGLELDFSSIRQSGKRAFGIAIAGISLPFLFGIALSFFLRKAVHGEDKVGYGQYLLFMGVALSITAFPVLARILAELKLLTTQVGQTAMAAAAFNDVAAWILLALAVALAGNGSTGDSRSPLYHYGF
ncbi:hypothetical protein GH714_013172 [Hevea brasiliensis]|uniref:Cation/H+ exchanger transmembrane domain-containing protein n=1 Tax=Hevea brasiliensis TaxID=3981 RepID=A0A6A6M0U3_HEVBR|nr:hypothetical protein GH714_013172 [Hevea brasiliensis]